MRIAPVSGSPYIFLLFLLPVLWAVSSCTDAPKAITDIVTNENTEADLGKIREEKGVLKARLIVANPTRDTLYPLQAFTLCTCLKAKVNRKPVAPGGNVLVELDYNPAYKKGIIMEEVQVIFDGSDYLMSLVVKGDVLPCKHPVTDYASYEFGRGLYISQEVVPFGKLVPGGDASVFIGVASDRRRPLRLGFKGQGENLRLRTEMELAREGHDTLHLHFTMPEDAVPGDTLLFPITLLVDGKEVDKPLVAKAIVKAPDPKEN